MDDVKRALLGDHEAAKLTHLSLFSGIGGLDLAAEMAGFHTVGQCEWADYPTKVLEKHWPDVPRWRDIRTLTGESFYEKTGLRTVDVISGGFPCQPFSVAGKRRGKEDDRYLWPEMLRVISELRPTWVVGENVAGIVNMAIDQVYADLENEGYAVQAFIIPACAVDAPHRRDRCAIIAYNNEIRRDLWRSSGEGVYGDATRHEADTGGEYVEDANGNGRGWKGDLCNLQCLQEQNRKREAKFSCKSGQISAAVAHAESDGLQGKRSSREQVSGARPEKAQSERCCDVLSDADNRGEPLRRDGELPAIEASGGIRANHAGGTAEHGGGERRTAQPGLGGVADGLSRWLDRGMSAPGCWMDEPDIPRITSKKEHRADRLKCLGNAVVPQQFYPVFQAIADIERGIVHG